MALRSAIKEVQAVRPFNIDAWVLLPDHLHCIWTLPDGDSDFSKRWGMIKARFTKKVGGLLVGGAHPTGSRLKKREGLVWQRRFWEHTIRDERDFEMHCDYIHHNPVKHGLVESPDEWEYSTFSRFVKNGIYTKNWGSEKKMKFPEHIGGE